MYGYFIGLQRAGITKPAVFIFFSGFYDAEHAEAERALPEKLRPDRVPPGAEPSLHPDLPAAHQGGGGHPATHDR